MEQSFKQRHLIAELVRCICRGSYAQACGKLQQQAGVLPLAEELALQQLLRQLQQEQKFDARIACEQLIEQLQLPDVDASIIASIDTKLPRTTVEQLYQRMLSQRYEHFYKQLKRIQLLELTIIGHMLVLYKHCTGVKRVQAAIDELQQHATPHRSKLYMLYALVVGLTFYLLTILL